MAVSAIALTSCKKEEATTTELGSATITGTIRADIDQTNDVNNAGLYIENLMPENVEGMTVKVTVDTKNWVQASDQNGYAYDKKVYTATTNAEGVFTLTIPATEAGYYVDLEFEDVNGVTRKMFTSDGSELTENSTISRNDASVYIYSGATLSKSYKADISALDNDAKQYGTATVYGSVYAYLNDNSDPGYKLLNSSSPFPGKEVVLTWDYAPYNTGYETPLSFTVDADGNYKAVIPTETAGNGSVDFYLGMASFTGDYVWFSLVDFSTDSTWQATYELNNNGGLYDQYESVSDGQILTGVDLYFDANPHF